jgi:hypothetical protein
MAGLGWAERRRARLGGARHASARWGKVWPLIISGFERAANRSSSVLIGTARHGEARNGEARNGEARPGGAKRGQAGHGLLS